MIDLEAAFNKYEDDFLKFEQIEVKLHARPDIHAFLLLDSLLPGTTDIVGGAEHDQIWLSIDTDKLAAVATEEHIRELRRCGVMYDEGIECLSMFV